MSVTYQCANCNGPVTNHFTSEKVDRYVGPKQEELKPYVRGLGHWSCKKCGDDVKVAPSSHNTRRDIERQKNIMENK